MKILKGKRRTSYEEKFEEGPGYQLWEDVTEGSPLSPVFESMDELVKWCEENETIFASRQATVEEWRRYLESGEAGMVFLRIPD